MHMDDNIHTPPCLLLIGTETSEGSTEISTERTVVVSPTLTGIATISIAGTVTETKVEIAV